MFSLLLLKKFLNAKSLAGLEAVLIVFLITNMLGVYQRNKTQRQELEAMQVSIQHPATVETKTETRQSFPIVVRKRAVTHPDGTKEENLDMVRFGEAFGISVTKQATPTSLAALETKTLGVEKRTDRFLVGVSHRDWTPNQLDHYGFWAGYSFANRLDLLAGVTKHDHYESNVMAVARF